MSIIFLNKYNKKLLGGIVLKKVAHVCLTLNVTLLNKIYYIQFFLSSLFFAFPYS